MRDEECKRRSRPLPPQGLPGLVEVMTAVCNLGKFSCDAPNCLEDNKHKKAAMIQVKEVVVQVGPDAQASPFPCMLILLESQKNGVHHTLQSLLGSIFEYQLQRTDIESPTSHIDASSAAPTLTQSVIKWGLSVNPPNIWLSHGNTWTVTGP